MVCNGLIDFLRSKYRHFILLSAVSFQDMSNHDFSQPPIPCSHLPPVHTNLSGKWPAAFLLSIWPVCVKFSKPFFLIVHQKHFSCLSNFEFKCPCYFHFSLDIFRAYVCKWWYFSAFLQGHIKNKTAKIFPPDADGLFNFYFRENVDLSLYFFCMIIILFYLRNSLVSSGFPSVD